MLDRVLRVFRTVIPRRIFHFLAPAYHFLLAAVSAFWHGFPSRNLIVIGVTGTNGKSTVVEMLRRIFEASGARVASISSIQFHIADREWVNGRKMTMPGRFFMQRFLKDASSAGCQYVILEVTSEGIKQFRHRFVRFAAAVLTNVTPEHIESHGSLEKYRAAKAKLFYISPIHILNKDDASFDFFAAIPSEKRLAYTLADYPKKLKLQLPGDFNRQNALAAVVAARYFGIANAVIYRALQSIDHMPGRLEMVITAPCVIVDYAHTPDALRKAYEVVESRKLSYWPNPSQPNRSSRNPATGFRQAADRKLICVLGAAGGGRDRWKRKKLGEIADQHCGNIILTDEDPYDEGPPNIIRDVKAGITHTHCEIVLDRRAAIHRALQKAAEHDTVIITGKGCEPWMAVRGGGRIQWDDRKVVREEFQTLCSA